MDGKDARPRDAGIKADGLELHELFRSVFWLHAALSAIMDQVHEQAGLRSPLMRVAGRLHASGPSTVPEVAADLSLSRQFVQTVCNELESSGLVDFSDNPRHKRSRLAALTKAGRDALEAAREREGRIIREALPDLDADEVRRSTRLLREIAGRLPRNADI